MPEIVYILTNSRMDDLVKIGRTENLPERMRSLSSHSGSLFRSNVITPVK